MADWDETSPDDSDLVSQYPANARAARDAVRTNFGVDHHETDDVDIGKHEVIQLTAEATPTIDAGDVGIWNDSGVLKTRAGAGAVQTVVQGGSSDALIAPSGTKLVFYQASAPTGWTQDTGVNDRVLKVVSGTGGGTGGSWTISGVTVNNHALTVSQMPSHNHGGSTGNRAPGTNTTGSHGHSGSAASNGNHRHNVYAGNSVSTTSVGLGALQAEAVGGSDSDLNEQYRTNVGESSNPMLSLAGAHTHSLSINNNGNHNHTVNSHDHSISSQGSGSGHNHGVSANGAWRPSHINVLVAEKD